jgi:hypothetical protein
MDLPEPREMSAKLPTYEDKKSTKLPPRFKVVAICSNYMKTKAPVNIPESEVFQY